MLARTLASIVLIPVALALVYLAPPMVFTLVLLLLSLVAMGEFTRLASPMSPQSRKWLLAATAGLILIAGLGEPATASTRIVGALALYLIFIGTGAMLTAEGNQHAVSVTAISLLGLLYIPAFLALLIPIRFSGANGAGAILFMLLVTWASDIGAYGGGRLLGRRKLAPSISPGKTVEGTIAGLLCAVGVGLLFPVYVPGPWNWATAALLSATGQVGDLFESMLKRGAGVKDASHLIPGHGGLLDRIDSMLFCCPVLYLLLVVRGS